MPFQTQQPVHGLSHNTVYGYPKRLHGRSKDAADARRDEDASCIFSINSLGLFLDALQHEHCQALAAINLKHSYEAVSCQDHWAGEPHTRALGVPIGV